MKAAVLHGKEDLRVEDVAEPLLHSGQVRLCIQAALTCGTDLKVFRRGYHAAMIKPPAIFGHEMAGVVGEVGAGVADWRVGDRVVVANSAPCGTCFFCHAGQPNLCDGLTFLNGAYAESAVVPDQVVRTNMLRLQPATPFADAALTEPLACVVLAVEETGLRHGERLLVVGTGPIGLMFIALARQIGCEVTAVGRGEHRLAAARRLGAAAAVDASGRETDLAKAVKASGTGPFDAVIEAVGKPEVWESSARLVRKGGRVNFFGGCPAGTSVRFETGWLHYSSVRLLASYHHTPQTVRRALDFIERGVVRAADFVDGECPLSELPALFKRMARGNRAIKTLIRVQE